MGLLGPKTDLEVVDDDDDDDDDDVFSRLPVQRDQLDFPGHSSLVIPSRQVLASKFVFFVHEIN